MSTVKTTLVCPHLFRHLGRDARSGGKSRGRVAKILAANALKFRLFENALEIAENEISLVKGATKGRVNAFHRNANWHLYLAAAAREERKSSLAARIWCWIRGATRPAHEASSGMVPLAASKSNRPRPRS